MLLLLLESKCRTFFIFVKLLSANECAGSITHFLFRRKGLQYSRTNVCRNFVLIEQYNMKLIALFTSALISMTSPRGWYTSSKKFSMHALQTISTPWGNSVTINRIITVISILVVLECSDRRTLLLPEICNTFLLCLNWTWILYISRLPNIDISKQGMSLATIAYIQTFISTVVSVPWRPNLRSSK